MKESFKKKIVIIHPGTQYAYRLANSLSLVNDFSKIYLYTWFLLSDQNLLSKITFFKKRVKPISKNVAIRNFPAFEFLMNIHIAIANVLKIKNGHDIRYRWQVLFGYFMLPILYLNRNNSILILSETCGWPIAKFAKKWQIPIVMDFPSISHEVAQKADIGETSYGIEIKSLERQFIDFGLNCSNFAMQSYRGLTSAKEHFAIWLGAQLRPKLSIKYQANSHLYICCLANTEKRKGLDILLKAFGELVYPNKKLVLIGKIDKQWVTSFCEENKIELNNIILTGAMAQQDLADFLLKEKINLHVLPSRFDSFGMVVPETMSLGIPNILSPYVGAGEMLDDGIDGFIMKSLDTNALSACIQKYIALSVQEKNILIQKVLEKSKQMTWDKYNERIHEIFNKITFEIQ